MTNLPDLIKWLSILGIKTGSLSGSVVANDTYANIVANYAAANFTGRRAFVNDVGVNGSYWQSSGTEWFPLAPITLYTSTDSYARAPTGTINTGSSGNITFGTAANRAYTEGMYVYLPSIATTPAITAGFYWCVMSNTTTGTLYASKGGAAINFTGGSAYTGVTTAIDIPQQTLKGGAMGSYRRLRITGLISATNNANPKTTTIKIGSTAVGGGSLSGSACWPVAVDIYNKTALLQFSTPSMFGSGGGSTTTSSINTASDQAYGFSLSAGTTASDWWVVDCWQAVLIPR